MDFIKGTVMGMIAGACIGYIENEKICELMKNGKKEFRKMKKKINL
jgi:hypothetical protein